MEFKIEYMIGQKFICKKDIYDPYSQNNIHAFSSDIIYEIIDTAHNLVYFLDNDNDRWYFSTMKESEYYIYDYFIHPSEWREQQLNSILYD